jgi:hypothetical protein
LLGDQDVIVSRFERYDKDKSGELDASQVAEVLKDLNGGKAVTDDEVKWVIESTDGRVVSTPPDVSSCLQAPAPRASSLLIRWKDVCAALTRCSHLVVTGPTSEWLAKSRGAEGGSCGVVHSSQ